MNDWIIVTILGFVQGATEFFPVSSTAHLRLISAISGISDPGAATSAVIQLGSWLALLFYFRHDIEIVLQDGYAGIKKGDLSTPGCQLAWQLILGTAPICILGLLFSDWIHGPLRSLNIIAISLILVGLWMGFTEYYSKKKRSLPEMTWHLALLIGLSQSLALVPGASRSGTTLAMALMLGFSRVAALRFSFLLSIPAIGLAGFYELFAEFSSLQHIGLLKLLWGTVVATVVSYACVSFLMRFVQKHTIYIFVIYRVLLGAIVLLAL